MEQKNAPAMPAEQAADLAELNAMVGDAPAAPGAAAEEAAPPAPNLAEELAALVTMAVATLSPAFPSLKVIYTEETTGAAAGAVARVCEKHGWMQGGLFGEWGEEIACAAIVLPLAVATVRGVRADMDAQRAKIEAPKKQPEPEVYSVIGDGKGGVSVNQKSVVAGAPIPEGAEA